MGPACSINMPAQATTKYEITCKSIIECKTYWDFHIK